MGTDALGIRSFQKDEGEPEGDLMDMFQDEVDGDQVNVDLAPSDDDAPLEVDDEGAPIQRTPEEEGQRQTADAASRDEEEPETAEDVREKLLAGKYKTPEELERAYLEVTTGFTRVSQDNQRTRQQNEQMAAQMQQQEEQLAQVVEFLQAQMAEQDPEFAEELQRKLDVQQQIEERVAPLQQRAQVDQQAVAQRARMEAAAADFYRRHPEVEPTSPQDVAMTQGIVQLMQAGVQLDLGNPEHLDVALEAAANPDLHAELMMAPAALQVPGGVARLRQRVGATLPSSEGPPRENGTRPKAPARQRIDTFVETGTGGAPQEGPPGRVPDEFDEAWTEYQKESSKKGVLFGSRSG